MLWKVVPDHFEIHEIVQKVISDVCTGMVTWKWWHGAYPEPEENLPAAMVAEFRAGRVHGKGGRTCEMRAMSR